MKKEDKFKTPGLILIALDDRKKSPALKAFQSGLDQLEDKYAVLSLYIPRKHLKNMLKALKLMDVTGVFLTGSHRKHARSFVDSGKGKKTINVVARRKKKYVGYNILSNQGLDAGMVSACIRLWTGKTIDSKRLSKEMLTSQ